MKVSVSNMRSSRGNDVPNQFIIRTDDGVYFQSYSSVICFEERKTNKVYLDKNKWDYSRTTGKYRNQFLGENKRETERKIELGKYELVDLNETR